MAANGGRDVELAGRNGGLRSCWRGPRVHQARLVEHLTIGDQVKIASGSGVTNDVKAGKVVGGRPAVEHALWRKAQVLQYQLPDMRKELRSLRKEVEELKALLKHYSANSNSGH